MNAIGVMWLRQLKRYWRSRGRMIGALGQPLLFLVALGFGFGAIYARAGEGNYIQFLTPGIIAMTILFSGIFSGMEVIWDRQFGFLKETLVAPVPRFHIMLGRTLGGATVSVFQGTVVFLISLFIGFKPIWGMVPFAILFMFLIAFLFTALGTAIASKLEDMQAFPIIINFLVMPLFFLSGALFPLTNISDTFSVIIKLNPLTYGVDGLRATLTGVSHIGVFIDLVVLISVALVIFGVGTWLFKNVEA